MKGGSTTENVGNIEVVEKGEESCCEESRRVKQICASVVRMRRDVNELN